MLGRLGHAAGDGVAAGCLWPDVLLLGSCGVAPSIPVAPRGADALDRGRPAILPPPPPPPPPAQLLHKSPIATDLARNCARLLLVVVVLLLPAARLDRAQKRALLRTFSFFPPCCRLEAFFSSRVRAGERVTESEKRLRAPDGGGRGCFGARRVARGRSKEKGLGQKQRLLASVGGGAALSRGS